MLAAGVRQAMGKPLLVSLLVGLTVFAVPSWLTRKSAAHARIAILATGQGDLLKTQRHSNRAHFVSQSTDKEAMGMHVRALQSRGLARAVANDFSLAARPQFYGALRHGRLQAILQTVGLAGPHAGESEEDGQLAAFQDALDVHPIAATRTIAIALRSDDPQLAADGANGLAERYRDARSSRRAREADDRQASVTRVRADGHASAIAGGNHARLLHKDAPAASFELAELGQEGTATQAPAARMDVEIIARASPPGEKARPQVATIVLAMLATVVLGSAAMVARELIGAARNSSHGQSSARFEDPVPSVAQPTLASDGAYPQGPPPLSLRSMSSVARRLVRRAKGRGGYRTLVAGATSTTATRVGALDLVEQLSRLGRRVLLVDWSLQDRGDADDAATAAPLGMADVLCGRATFEDVIERIAHSDAHRIAFGSRAVGKVAVAERDGINMHFDALDEAYDHIVIVGSEHGLRDLVAMIEGRIDAAVCVADGKHDMHGYFLSLHVPDLPIIYCRATLAPMLGKQGYNRAAVS
jgi:hypothetical protein